jgi:hypothetical protein
MIVFASAGPHAVIIETLLYITYCFLSVQGSLCLVDALTLKENFQCENIENIVIYYQNLWRFFIRTFIIHIVFDTAWTFWFIQLAIVTIFVANIASRTYIEFYLRRFTKVAVFGIYYG